MSDITQTLKECHAVVWRYRAELEHVWPTPTTEDALLFAFTELGEAVDAYLRSKPEYARNRDKDLSVLDELADCAMMLLTALGEGWVFTKTRGCACIADATMWAEMARTFGIMLSLLEVGRNFDNCRLDVHRSLCRIATHPGMNLPARLTARLERIKAKRLVAA